MKGIAVFFITLVVGLIAASRCISTPRNPVTTSATTIPQEGRPNYIIGVDGDYPPFTYRDGEGRFTGLDIEAAHWIANREGGFDVEFVAVPWDGILAALKAGTIDMVYSGMTITKERQKNFDFTIPYYTANQSIAIRRGSNLTMQDLFAGRLLIGAQAGSTGAAWGLENLIQTGKMPSSHLLTYPDLPILTKNLANGTIDASIVDTPSQKRAIAGRSLLIIGEIPTMEQYAVAVRKTDPALLAVMDDGLRQLMNDSYWHVLLKKYELE